MRRMPRSLSVVVVVLAMLGPGLILPAVGAAVAVLGFGLWLHRRLGGLTGDVYGAAIELGETAMLILCTVHQSGAAELK